MSAAILVSETDGPSVETRLLSCLLLDSDVIEKVSQNVSAADFFDFRARTVYNALLQHGPEVSSPEGGVDLALLQRLIERRGQLGDIGGANYFIGLDIEATPALALRYADEVKRDSIVRRIRRHLDEMTHSPEDAESFESLRNSVDELRSLELISGTGAQTSIGLSGPNLLALANTEASDSPLPGFLDLEPSLHIVHGVAKTGKTTLAWHLGLSWAAGRAPWPSAPELPGTRVLILSGEQSASKCCRVLTRLAETTGIGPSEEWSEKVTVVGRRRGMPAVDRRLLRLDEEGFTALKWTLEQAKREGRPFGLVIADSLSRLKPPGCNTNDNDDMISVLDPLAAIATEMRAYFLLIHHDGHNAERQGKAIDGVRGASAIRDVPQALWAVSRLRDEPRQRRIRIAGNEVPDLTVDFQVALESEPEGFINRFTPVSELALDLDEIFRDGPLRMLEFGRRALNWAEDWAPSGSAKNKAKKKLESLENQGLVKKKGSAWDIIRP